MSGVEALAIISCVAAIVSAFHGGAELSEIIKDRKEKRKKKKQDKDAARQIAQQEILRESLLAGGQQVDTTSYEHRRDFGVAFERGDQIAELQLMRVTMNLQSEVIRALQMARDLENAALNMTRLCELSIMNRQAAINSMDELCQRLRQSAPIERQLPSPVSSPENFGSLAYSLPTSNLRSMTRRGSDENLQVMRAPSVNLPTSVIITGPLEPVVDTSATSPLARTNSNASFVRSFGWIRGQLRVSDSDTIRTGRIVEERTETDLSPTRSYLVTPPSHSVQGGSSRAVRHQSVPNVITSHLNPTLPHHGKSLSATETVSVHPRPQNHPSNLDDRTPSLSSDSSNNTKPQSSSAASVGSNEPTPLDPHDPEASALELVTPETAPRHSRTSKFWHDLDAPNLSDSIKVIPPLLKNGPLNPWMPLEAPDKTNHFYGYCEGAWQSREHALLGLKSVMKPFGLRAFIPYWQCKKCCFGAKSSSNNKDQIPRTVSIAANGIRYRWVFLARSHLKSNDPCGKHDAYTYGCIICTAQGKRDTAGYGQINVLMAHIMNVHGVNLSREVKNRTRAITGRFAESEEEWDINIPSMTSY